MNRIVARETADEVAFRKLRTGLLTMLDFTVYPQQPPPEAGDIVHVLQMERCHACDGGSKRRVLQRRTYSICQDTGTVAGEEIHLKILSGAYTGGDIVNPGDNSKAFARVEVMTPAAVRNARSVAVLRDAESVAKIETLRQKHDVTLPPKEIPRAHREQLKSTGELKAMLDLLVRASCSFAVIPLPDDVWEVEVKKENARQLQDWVVALRGGGALAQPAHKEEQDPAAVMAIATSLRHALEEYERKKPSSPDLSDMFQGVDNMYRACMRVATTFEGWTCKHVSFDAVTDVWPYFLEDKFGDAYLKNWEHRTMGPGLEGVAGELTTFNETDCTALAMRLNLPILHSQELMVPILVEAPNTVIGSPYRHLRIQTARHRADNEEAGWEPMQYGDDPNDVEYASPVLALYGVLEDGAVEHLSDHGDYALAVERAKKLAPGIDFPKQPVAMPPGS